MIFIDKMRNMKIYRTQLFLPTLKKDKKRGSSVIMLTPNYQSSKKIMNHPLLVNRKRYESYYMERDVSYYINQKNIAEVDDQDEIQESTEYGDKSIVYFVRDITPENVVRAFEALGVSPKAPVACKVHSGEKGNRNFIRPEFWKPLIDKVNGKIVECNTAYEGERNTTEKHKALLQYHGWINEFDDVDIMDSDGESTLFIENGLRLDRNYIGSHMNNYNSMIVLSHMKAHSMGGFGGALKQLSIGCASSNGKKLIHGWGEVNRGSDNLKNFTGKDEDIVKEDQIAFTEAMADAANSVVRFFKSRNGEIVYINLLKNISIDCDCDAHAHAPCINDIGILVSMDPVAIDQAGIDLIRNSEDPEKEQLIHRIESRYGEHILEAAESIGLGNRDYDLISLDNTLAPEPVSESYHLVNASRLYRLDSKDLDGKFIYPEIPKNFLTKHNFENKEVKRVCFSPSIDKCLRALSENIKGKTFYVHIPDPDKEYNIYKPNKEDVPDADLTGELWIRKPVMLKCLGKIKVGSATGKGLEYSYGEGEKEKTAELYDWNWTWIDEYDDDDDDDFDFNAIDDEYMRLMSSYRENSIIPIPQCPYCKSINIKIKAKNSVPSYVCDDCGRIISTVPYSGVQLQEGVFVSEHDIYYNKDKFDNGDINLCFITGLSGSGKSTMAGNMEKNGVEKYELDDLFSIWRFSDDNLKEYGDLIYSFFNGIGKKYREYSYEEFEEKYKEIDETGYEIPLLNDFIQYCKNYANSHKNKKFVIEGVELFWYKKPEDLKDYAVYIKGTSTIKSMIRGSWRDAKNDSKGFKRLVSFIKSNLNIDRFKAFLKSEKDVQKWRDYYNKLESVDESTKIKYPICPKCGPEYKVNIIINGEPVFICDHCGKYLGTVPFSTNEAVTTDIIGYRYLDRLNSDIKEICKNLKCKVPNIPIVFVDSIEQLRKTAKKDIESFIRGYAYDGTVYMVTEEAYDNNGGEYYNVLLHECIHAVLASMDCKVDEDTEDGLTTWLSGQYKLGKAASPKYLKYAEKIDNLYKEGGYDALIKLIKGKSYSYLSESAIREYDNVLNTGDKLIFFNEDTKNDTKLKQMIFKNRMRQRKQLLLHYDQVKRDNSWIKYTFPVLSKYMYRNIYYDTFYYNQIFFQTNNWVLRKGLVLYTEFMNRLLNEPKLDNAGYKYKTIIIPVEDWNDTRKGQIWNFRQNLNPISVIYQMMFENNLNGLIRAFNNLDIIFLARDKYFKMNFSQIDPKELKRLSIKFRTFVNKICDSEEFDAEDIDTSADYVQSPEVIQANLVDKIESTRGIDLTAKVAIAREDFKKRKEAEDKNNYQKAAILKSASISGNVTLQDAMPKTKPTKEVPVKKSQLIIAPTTISNTQFSTKSYIQSTDELTPEEEQELAPKISLAKKNQSVKQDNTDQEKERDADELADVIVDASEDNNTDQDADDFLDNTGEDEDVDTGDIEDVVVALGSDDSKVEITPARKERIKELDEKLLNTEINGRKVEDILKDPSNKKEELTTINVASPNEDEWKDLGYINFDKNYNLDKDIISILRMFSTCSRPISVRDIKVTNNSTSEDRLVLYDVDMEDYRGKRFKLKFDVPIMVDNRFKLRGNYKSIQSQFMNMPIIKTDQGDCQIVSCYNKIILYRFGGTGGKSLPITSRFLKATNKYKGDKIKFIPGDNRKIYGKYNLPIDYIDIGSVYSRIETSDIIFYFDQDQIRKLYKVEESKGIPFYYNKKEKALYYIKNYKNRSAVATILDIIKDIDPSFIELFNSMSAPVSTAYTRASILNTKIPLIVVLGYYEGLRKILSRAEIPYELKEKITKEDKIAINKDWVRFSDGYVVFESDYDSSLLLNGLKQCSTELFKLEDIDNQNMYLEFLDQFGGRIKADGLDNFKDLMIDPMTESALKHYNMPTDFIDVLLEANSMLSNNGFVRHVDTTSRRIRRYELVAAYTYLVLTEAYARYAQALKHSRSGNVEFSVKQSAVIDRFMEDPITSDDSCINALRDVETTNSITTKGPSGMNSQRAYSLDKRTYDDSMTNVVGMSTGFAGNVGITRQSTMNPKVTSDGYVVGENGRTDNMNDANSLTASEAIVPFSSTRDDPMRTAMTFVQTAKHSVRTEDSDPLLVTSGADEVMPYLTTNKFAYKAKNKGTIKELDESHILVEYVNGEKEWINLTETIEKNSDGGYYVPLKLDADEKIKVGSAIKKDQIIAYDKYSFSNKLGESNNLAYNVGKLAKVAVINTDESFEDSGIISHSLAKKLATRIDLQYRAVVDAGCEIFYASKVGEHIEAGDNLLIWREAIEDAGDDDLLTSLSNSDLEVSDLDKRKLTSEVTGTLKGIKIYRTIDYAAMSSSMEKLVKEYEKPIIELEKKMKAQGLDTSELPAHTKLVPNGIMKKAQNAILIEFYVEYLDTVGVGDKVTYNAANKAVEKAMFPIGKEPYTAFRPNEKIDAFVGESSIAHRNVSSILVYGSMQKLMVELDRHVKDIMNIKYDDSTI